MMAGPLRIILKSIVGLVALLVITILVALLLGISLNLNAMREPLATAAGSALGREFIIEGDVQLEVSFTPKFDVSDVRLSNPEGFGDSPFATLDDLQLQVRALPLLLGELNVISFSAEGVELNLESDAQGNGNWNLPETTGDAQSGNNVSMDADSSGQNDRKDIAFEVKEMTLKSVVVNYTDRALDKRIAFELGQLSGALGAKTPVQIETEGTLQEVPFSLAVDAPSLMELAHKASVSRAEINGEIASTPLSFIAELSHESGEPSLAFSTEIASIDVGGIIAWFGIAEDLHVVTEKLSIDARVVGDSLKDILEKSMLTATLSAGEALVGQGAGKEQLSIDVENINLAIEPDKPVQLDLTGKLDQHDLKIKAESGRLIDFVRGGDAVPARIDITFADATLAMDSELTLPITTGAIDLALQVKGEKLSTFNQTFYLDLPSLGPYSLEGQFHLEPGQLSLKEMQVAVGTSQLTGALMVDKSGNKPRIDLALHSPLLQINDFNLQGWSPEKKKISDQKKETETETPGQTGARVRSVLSAEVLNSFDANVDLRIDQVLSGGDKLGDGEMALIVENGQLRIEPIELSVPGGSVNLGFRYRPMKENVELHLEAKVSRFDYGILARRIKPDSPMDGKLFLDIGLDAVAKDLQGLLKTGKGHFDFA
ncbi:MAG: AsmA family protein, partial [Chromatiales bacterium]